MRGKEVMEEQTLNELRITPAHAGKSSEDDVWKWELQDHPRACGEKFFSSSQRETMQGSPPRMRGKVDC